MNAERDYDLHVEQNWHTLVGNEEHREINKNQYQHVGGDAHLKIVQDQIVEVDGNRSETIQGNNIRTVQGNSVHKSTLSHASQTNGVHSISAVGQVQIISDTAGVIIDGGQAGIYLVSGQSAISINPITGVTIQPFPKPGLATPIPPIPAPPVVDSDELVPPKWPGDDPRAI